MNYKDYQNARDTVWKMLLDCEVKALPVDVVGICRQLGISVKTYIPNDENDGMSIVIAGKPVILVSRLSSRARQRFTVAHELGHILLGHAGKCCREVSSKDNPIEQAANVFASRLLAPACVLWACEAWTAEQIAQLCEMSLPAAGFRAQRMALLRERGKFLSSPMEREVYRQFLPFIENQKSASGS